MTLRELAGNQQQQRRAAAVGAYSKPQEREPAAEAQAATVAPALPLQRQQENDRAAAAAALDVCREYQENIKRAEGLRTGILKGLEAGENPYKLLYMAAECIGRMTGETRVFADTVKGHISEVYGDALQVPQAAALELEDVRARLAMLRRTELTRTRNIDAAIRAHEQRERELLALQARADN